MGKGRSSHGFALVTALALVISVIASSGSLADDRATVFSAGAESRQVATCVGSVGPTIPPPASVPSGIPGFHAHW